MIKVQKKMQLVNSYPDNGQGNDFIGRNTGSNG